jgi:ABC-2 type transport system ATP-binding protein
MPQIPESLASQLSLVSQNGDLTIETPGELSGLLGWLATLPLAEVRIEPLGLAALYEQYHFS